MKHKIIYALLAIVSLPAIAETNNASTGLSFLKLGVGARAIGMGEAYSAISDDVSGIYYNPAGLAFGETNEIAMMHKQWAFGTAMDFLGSTLHVNPFTFGFGFNTSTVDGIEIRQQPGPSEGSFGLHDLAISATASWRIDSSLSVGATAKYLYEKIYVDESNGAALDFGIRYKYSSHLAIALAVSNLGSMSKLVHDPITLPAGFRGGISYSSALTDDFAATVAGDFLKVIHDNGTRVHLGGEINYRSSLAIRGGYQIGYEAKGLSVGFGVQYSLLQFDYAFVPFLNQLGDTHTFALTFSL